MSPGPVGPALPFHTSTIPGEDEPSSGNGLGRRVDIGVGVYVRTP